MRKSILMAGSALAVAGLTTAGAQEAKAVEFTLGMYMPFVLGVADSDNTAESQTGLGTTDTEFYVTASETLENGINVAVKFQFDAVGDVSTNNTDETEIEISGSFGLISLGHEDGPADLLNLGATKVKVWAFGSFANTTGTPVNYTQFSGAATSNEAGLDTGDAVKIAYYTPRWNGLQVGAAWAKSTEVISQGPATNRSGWEAAVNYQNTIGDVGIGLAASYFYGDQPDALIAPLATQDSHRWSVGAQLDYMNFSLSGQFSNGERSSGQEVETFDIGVAYNSGPWGVHVVYEHGEADPHAVGLLQLASGDAQMIHTGISYALGPGVSVGASLGFGEDDADAIAGGMDKDYTIFTTGIVVSF